MSEGKTINTVNQKIIVLVALREGKNSLQEELKITNEQIERAEREVITAMLDMAEEAGLDDVSALKVEVNGYRYGVAIKPYYTIKAADRKTGFDALRDLGLGDLISERVDDRTLTKTLQQLSEENGGDLPEEYQIIPLKLYEKTTISSRKIGK